MYGSLFILTQTVLSFIICNMIKSMQCSIGGFTNEKFCAPWL